MAFNSNHNHTRHPIPLNSTQVEQMRFQPNSLVTYFSCHPFDGGSVGSTCIRREGIVRSVSILLAGKKGSSSPSCPVDVLYSIMPVSADPLAMEDQVVEDEIAFPVNCRVLVKPGEPTGKEGTRPLKGKVLIAGRRK